MAAKIFAKNSVIELSRASRSNAPGAGVKGASKNPTTQQPQSPDLST